VPLDGLARVLLHEPHGLCVGKVRLTTGEEVLGVLGEPALVEGQREITEYGGWREYLATNPDAKHRVEQVEERVATATLSELADALDEPADHPTHAEGSHS
jgi:hypothetical protein